MKKKNKLFWSFATSLLLVGVVLVSCGPEEEEEFDVSWLLEKLTTTEFAQTGTLEIYGGTVDGASDTVTIDIESVWDGEFFYLEHTYYNDDGTTETANTRVYKNSEGLVVARYLNYDNTYVDDLYYNSDSETVYFDDEYNNPFKNVTVDDFDLLERAVSHGEVENPNDVYVFLNVNEEDTSSLSYFLVGYQDIPIENIQFVIDEDLTVTGSISFYEEYEEDGVNKYSGGSYEFTLVSQDSVDSGKVTQFELTEDHATLSNTLTKLSEHNFTMSLVRTSTSYNTAYETLETANASLRTNDVDESDISNKTYVGYYQNDDGLHSVTSEGYTLTASGYPTTSYGLSTLRSTFGLSAALFDVVDENTFVLKEGYESYAMYGAVDYRYNYEFLYYLDAGSYTIKVLDDSVEVSYSYTYYDYGNLVTGTVEIKLTDIGTTSIDNFTFVAYSDPDTWDSYGSSTTEILSKYLDNKYNDILPFIDLSQYNSNSKITEYTSPTRGVIFIQDDNSGAGTFVGSYRESLESVGWVQVTDKEDYSYIYPKDDGNGYYHLRTYPSDDLKYVYIFLYEKGGTLADYLNGKYGSTINSTVSITQETTYYTYTNQEKGSVYSGPNTTTYEYLFLDDQVLKTENTSSGSTYITYFAAYDDGTFYIYSYGSYTNAWSRSNRYDSSYNLTVPTYTNYGTYPPTALVEYASYLTYRSGTDAIYDVVESAGSLLAQYVFGVSSYTAGIALSIVSDLEIDYFNNEFTISLTLQRTSGSYLIEDVYTATYSNFGSTKITRSDLPDPSQFQ